jgi:hypothetical protein
MPPQKQKSQSFQATAVGAERASQPPPLIGKGASVVSISISGQNERWAQINAYQSPSSPSGQNSTGYPAIGTTTSPPPPGSTAPSTGALSDGTSLALIAFGSLGNAQTAPQSTGSQAGGQANPTSTGAQDESSLEAQILGDVQSLISSLTGATTTSGTASASQGSLTTASATPAAQPSGPPPGPPPWSNAISNDDTNAATGNAGGAAPGYSDAIQQQFALSAYGANASGLDSSATSALTNISV